MQQRRVATDDTHTHLNINSGTYRKIKWTVQKKKFMGDHPRAGLDRKGNTGTQPLMLYHCAKKHQGFVLSCAKRKKKKNSSIKIQLLQAMDSQHKHHDDHWNMEHNTEHRMPKSLLVAYRNCDDLHIQYLQSFFVNLATFTKALNQFGSYLFVCLFVVVLELHRTQAKRLQKTKQNRQITQRADSKCGICTCKPYRFRPV